MTAPDPRAGPTVRTHADGYARVPMARSRRPAARGRRLVRIAAPVVVALAALVVADPAAAPEAAGRVPDGTPPAADGAPFAGALPAGGAVPSAAAPGMTGGAASALLPQGPVALVRSEPVRLRVDRLGVDTAPVPLGLHPDGSMEVPDDAGTVGWFTGAPTPGELGPAVLAAHVDWKGLPGAFADLDTLEAGDEIHVGRADGTTVVFAVTRVGQYPKAEFPTEEVYGDLDHAGLRLITCGGAFDRTADSYTDNVVVFAEQVR